MDSPAARPNATADFHYLWPRGEKSKPVRADFLFLIVQENEHIVHCPVVSGRSLVFSSRFGWTIWFVVIISEKRNQNRCKLGG